MQPREFHIWQFPEDKVRILFKGHSNFIEEIVNRFRTQKKLAEFLQISPSLMSQWKRIPLYIPLKHTKKIVKELNLNWNDIEKRINNHMTISNLNKLGVT